MKNYRSRTDEAGRGPAEPRADRTELASPVALDPEDYATLQAAHKAGDTNNVNRTIRKARAKQEARKAAAPAATPNRPHADERERLRAIARDCYDLDTGTVLKRPDLSAADRAAMIAETVRIDGGTVAELADEHPIYVCGVFLGALRREAMKAGGQ